MSNLNATGFNPTPAKPTAGLRARQSGFTLLELSVVLVVIGLIVAAVTIGKDVQRNAAYQRISSDFVQGWMVAYDGYVAATGIVPGDNSAAPTGLVNQGGTALCGNALLGAMQAAGIAMPEGRAEGSADRYGYLDSNGIPHEVQVCFGAVAWTEPGATPGTYVVRTRNVMELSGVTPALANFLDNTIDGHADASFGRVRESTQAGQAAPVSAQWSVDERMAYGSTTATSLDESQVAEVSAYIKTSQ